MSTDCLVLCIEELTSVYRLNNKIYLYYDTRSKQFFINGSRNMIVTTTFEPYAFTCKKIKDTSNFIDFIITPDTKCVVSMYHYDNFPESTEEITYDFISTHQENSYIVASRNYDSLQEETTCKMLNLLKTVYNEY